MPIAGIQLASPTGTLLLFPLQVLSSGAAYWLEVLQLPAGWESVTGMLSRW